MNQKLKQLREKAMRLPLTPGVYIMKNKNGDIIYIGKAKALKNRVSQYFGSDRAHSIKVIRMVENVDDFDYILVGNEFEALVLECSLIKLHNPKYNILLKDDKGYSYIRVAGEEWPVISAVLQKADDGAEYIGPYMSSASVRQTVDEANSVFHLPTCGKTFPCRTQRPCLNYYIKLCDAPCSGKISQEEYKKNADAALEFIRGGSRETLERLNKEMLEAAENLEFERAAKLRDRIRSIEKINEKQRVVTEKDADCDVFAIADGPDKSCLNVLRFRKGRLVDGEYFYFESDTPEHARKELLTSYYSIREDLPKEILTDGEVEDSELLSQWLTEKRGKRVTIAAPKRGEKLRLVEMCRKNASEKLFQRQGRVSKDNAALEELRELLGLKTYPDYIESYDISHTAGSDNVAGMVVFKNGKPYKSAYRKFAIKGFVGQDDYRSMAEVLERRFTEYFKHKDSGEGFGKLPDLILLDGGQGQVNAVQPVLGRMGIDVPVFGMVKDDRHRTRAITGEGGEIEINSKRAAFTLVSSLQDEVHRFSVGYHHQKHTKSTFRTELTGIGGVGEKKAAALIKRFKTIKAIRAASVEKLCEADGIGEALAQTIWAYYHAEETDE
ncbi:MAG: excinuclease ABC subunit UvrC [Clostridia bacterium]|nr:excinuclease ABC subunit UvrC [Clostridia bacterium]